MKVTYIDHMGSDLSVVNAARVSFKKTSRFIEESEDGDVHYDEPRLSDKDVKLINYLAKHDHWTPFGHTAVTLHFKTPLFVARQLAKHQVGMVWNEVSRRYVDDEPEFYYPETWRARAENVKQGSSTTHHIYNQYDHMATEYIDFALTAYKDMLADGVAPEQARMVLPQSMYTEWYWTGNLYAWANVYLKRTDSHAQKEVQDVAHQLAPIMEGLYPVSWEALVT